jgi:two-component system, response regulator YesN
MIRTLIVEDSVLFRQVFQEALHARFPSMEIVEALCGEEALVEIRDHLPDLVFIDINLGGENGLELAHKIKTQYPDLVTILLTNYDFPEYRDAAFRYKINHFLPKDSFMKMVDAIFLGKNKHPGNPGEQGPGLRKS